MQKLCATAFCDDNDYHIRNRLFLLRNYSFVYEAILTLGTGLLSSFLSDSMVNEMSCVGSVLIIAIAPNTMKVTKIKVANLLPSAFMPLLLCLFIH